jgi:hypothetical protein
MPLNIGMEAYYSEKDGHYPRLMNLLEVPKEKRREFSEHVLGMWDWGYHKGGFYPSGNRKGDAAFKKAEGHIRGLLGALDEIAKAGDTQLFVDAVYANSGRKICFGEYEPPEPPLDGEEPVFDDYRFVSASTSEILDAVLHPIAAALADLVGRYPKDPQAKDPMLNAVIRDIRTWPERFGAVGIADTRSKRLEKAIGILHEIWPDIVPENVSPNTIKTIWKPRPTKRRKR